MSPLHLTISEPIQWYFNLLLLVLVGGTGWFAFRALKAFRATRGLASLLRVYQEASIPTSAISKAVWLTVIFRTGLAAFCIAGLWVIIDANFRSFHSIDITMSTVRLAYRWSSREIPLSTIQSVTLAQAHRRKHRLEIRTADGAVYRSVTTDSDAVISECQNVVTKFQIRAA